MNKILGLDLGSASIGWAVVDESSNETKILGMGSRIIPYNGTEDQDFTKGAGETRNSVRTQKRTMRKGYDRYQQRRQNLINLLKNNDMMPDESLMHAPKMALWELRSKAVTENISRQELGRLYLWLNQKRGYKSSRSDASLDKKETDYVQDIKDRYDSIRGKQTIGQCFYEELRKDEYFRVKENVFPREAYKEEFDAISERQKQHLGLADEFIERIKDEIIYYQRPLKSQKGLVSVCEFEGRWIDKDGKKQFIGPKVAPKSSPLFQYAKIWESVNNINITDKSGKSIPLTQQEKNEIVRYMDENENLSSTKLLNIIKRKKGDCVLPRQFEGKGLQGNISKSKIAKILDKKYNQLLELNLTIKESNQRCCLFSKKTGEIVKEKMVKYIHEDVEKSGFYQLWHTIYSINDMDECSKALQKKFSIDSDTADKLAALDFSKYGFGNKSAKAIRKILPYLMEGDMYSEAMCYAGYDHSNSLTKDENERRTLDDKLKLIEKNSLRQPIVEKILNQMVHVVNAIIDEYGKPDEIHIELARELKQSKEERNKTTKRISEQERINEKVKKELEESGFRVTRNNILKYRLYKEIGNDSAKTNAICIYCGRVISLSKAINGEEVDIEHIIPRSKLFDDSQSNKTLVHRKCNSDKGDLTAYDFMKSKSPEEFEAYEKRVNELYADKIISKAKRDKLLMPEDKIPDNFIDRQLCESQYIARKAKEYLQEICCQVVSTSGAITAELRHLWGWDDITMNLQMPKYKELGQTERVEWTSDHGSNQHSKEVITDWTKRDDHRHHAIDALVIACTKRSFIQQINTLNSSKTKEDMRQEIEKRSVQYREKLSLLEKYIVSQCPLSACEVEKATAEILVSFKAGKKVAVVGTRKVGKRGNKTVVQRGIIVPRGALSEESVYGKIKVLDKDHKLKDIFENPSMIFKPYIKALVEQRLAECDGDAKKALASLKKSPIYLDKNKTKVLEYATCFKEEYVIKTPVDTLFKAKWMDDVVDGHIREVLENRLAKFKGNPKEAFADVATENGVVKWYQDEGLERPIRSVRLKTGLSAVVPNNKDGKGYVKPGNNHHIAIYQDGEGSWAEHVCTFWHAVERKKYGLPSVIEHPNAVWDKVQSKDDYPQNFLELLPPPNSELVLSMQQNEMFILGMTGDEIREAMESKERKVISDHLYRVQKLASKDYVFRHHLETTVKDGKELLDSKRFYRVSSLKTLRSLNPTKVRIDYLGNIESL